MDEAGRSHFAVEVEDLDHRISTLRDSITSLHQTFNTRKTDIEERHLAACLILFSLTSIVLMVAALISSACRPYLAWSEALYCWHCLSV